MVDLPGQGDNPGRGLPFTAQANEAVSASLDWIEQHDKHVTNIAISSGWLMNGLWKLAGKFNESSDITSRKYAWQF